MPSQTKPLLTLLSKLLAGLLSVATWIGTFVIEGLWWLIQFLWWMCNFVGSLVLSLFGMVVGLFGKSKRKGLGKFAKNIQKKTSKHRAGVIGKLMSKPVRRRLLPGLAVVLLFLAGFAVYRSRQAPEAEAGWWNETWIYRRAIEISNSNGEDLEDFQVALELDTATLIADGKMQSDCADLRVTDASGKLIPHWIEENNPGCNNAATKIWTKVPTVYDGANATTVYVYYGNAQAGNVENFLQIFNSGGIRAHFFSHNSGHPTNEAGMDDLFENYITGFYGQQVVEEINCASSNCNPFGSNDYYASYFEGFIYIPEDGTYHFATDSDDASDIFISGDLQMHNIGGVNVVNWYGGHGVVNNWSHNGSIYLTEGYHSYIYRHEEVAGGDVYRAAWMRPGDSDYQYIGANDFFSRNYAEFQPTTALSFTEEITPGPIAWWKFDEGTGATTHDASGQGNDGTLTNGPTWTTEDQCVMGKCLQFNGDNTYANVINNGQLNFGGKNFTISMWVKNHWDGSVGFNTLIGTGNPYNANGKGWMLRQTDLNTLRFHTRQEVDASYNRDWSISLSNHWTLVSLVIDYDSGNASLFINDSFIGNNSIAAIQTDFGTSPIRIGNYGSAPGSNRGFSGFIDDVKIYPYARTEEQIKADYAAGLAGMSTPQGASATHGSYSPSWMSDGLVGYWKMDESAWSGVAGEVIDASGNGNHGTAINGVSTGVGKFGSGGAFPQTNSTYVLGVSSGFSNQAGTISFWIKTNWNGNDSVEHNFITVGSPGSNGLLFRKTHANVFNFETYNSTDCVSAVGYCDIDYSATSWLANEWRLLTISWNNTGKSMYIDGELVGSSTNDTFNETSTDIYIGSRPGLPSANAAIDEVRVYNRALSPAEVKALYEWAPGPVGHYTFDSGDSTTLNDISGYNNNGTWSGSTTQRYVTGKFGKAGNLNGTDDFAQILGLYNKPQELTLSAWINLDSADTSGSDVITLGDSVALRVHDGTAWGWFYNGTSWPGLNYTTTVAGSGWQHLAYTFSNSKEEQKLYYNGVLVNSGTDSTTISYSLGNNSFIGKHGNAGINWDFNGLIDDVRIYNYARTQQQILEDMQGGPPSATRVGGSGQLNPIAHWKFDEGSGTTVHDSISESLDGTVSGAATWTTAGAKNRAMSFNGTSGVVIHNKKTFLASEPWSFSLWQKTSTTSWNGFLGSVLGNDGYWMWHNSGRLTLYLQSPSPVYFNSVILGNQVPLGQWFHLIVVSEPISSNSVNFHAYVNGKLTQTLSNVVLPNSQFSFEYIGRGSADRYFNGLIDEVKIYNYALTPEEVKLDYNQGMSTVMGVMGTDDTGQPTQSASAEYCIPGDTSHCAPPVARWDFEEGEGDTARDTSGNGNDGTLINSPDWVTGKVGKALSFNGSNYINTDYYPTDGLKTIMGWVKYNQITSGYENTLVGSHDGSRRFYISMNNEGVLFGAGGSALNSNIYPEENEYYHLAMVLDNTHAHTYLNGIFSQSFAYTWPTGTSSTPIRIGTLDATSPRPYRLSGIADQVRIYDYARTPAQIAWDYNRGAPVGHWKFDECQGTTAHDVSGNENHGTINIGSGIPQTSAGTCTSGNSAHAWNNGREGRINSAMSFDGIDDFINAGNQTGNFSSSGTISAWVQTDRDFPSNDTSSKHRGIISKTSSGGSAGISYYMDWYGTNSSRTLRARIGDGTSSSQGFTISNFSFNQGWNHLVYSWSGVQHNLYINNQPQTPVNQTINAQILIDTPLRIGSAFSDTNSWDGLIDDVRIYNYALTPLQIKTLYNDGAAIKFGN